MDIISFVTGFQKGKASVPPAEGGSAELNIAYGDTAPEDTTKLWVKAEEPRGVLVSKDLSNLQEGGIETLAEKFPYEAWKTTSAVIGTKIYFFGGKADEATQYNTISCFDAESGTFTTIQAVLPYAGLPGGTATVGTRVYLLGGSKWGGYFGTILCFDAEDETVETLSATLPQSAYAVNSAVHGSNVYFIGGRYGYADERSQIFRFDTERNTVEKLDAVLPTAWYSSAFATVGNRTYLFGNDCFDFSNWGDEVVCFDAETETVRTVDQKILNPKYNICASAIGNKVYLFGGAPKFNPSNGTSGMVKTIMCFDADTETFENMALALPKNQTVATAQTVGKSIYMFGGLGETYTASTYQCFDVYRLSEASFSLQDGVIQIAPSETENVFRVINTPTAQVEIGVGAVYKGNGDNEGEPVEAALYKDGTWSSI